MTETGPRIFSDPEPRAVGVSVTSRTGGIELTIRGISHADMADAQCVIAAVARQLDGKPLDHGERLVVPHASACLAVRLFEGTILRPGARGDATPVAGHQLVDFHAEARGVPHVALSTVALWQADRAVAGGERDLAIAILEDCRSRWPGEPDSGPEPDLGVPYNWQNARVYARLVDLLDDPRRRTAMMQAAFDRSAHVVRERLGAPLEALADLTRADVLDRARMIARSHFSAEPAPCPVQRGRVLMPAPVWTQAADGSASVNLIAVTQHELDLYYRRAARGFDLQCVVDDVLDGLSNPARLAAELARERWSFGHPGAPTRLLPFRAAAVDHLVSCAFARTLRRGPERHTAAA